MKHYSHCFHVCAALEDVAAFHHSTEALKRLTPPPVFIQLHNVEPMGENSKSEFTMWIGPVPIRWTAVHSDYHPNNGFVDTQLKGPFKTWVHRHTFIALDDHTVEITDEVFAEFGDTLIKWLISAFMWINLGILFSYRQWMTKRIVQKYPNRRQLDVFDRNEISKEHE